MTQLNKSVWEKRHTTRLFSEENTNIPKHDLEYLETVINNIPSQCSIKSHFWVYLGQSDKDKELRKWLADNVFFVDDEIDFDDGTTDIYKVREHMLGVIQAPSILLSVMCNTPWANPEEGKSYSDHVHLADRSEGFFAGVLLATLLHMNYDVATFGCNSGLRQDRKEKMKTFNDMIRERYSDDLHAMISKYPGKKGNWEDIEFKPGLATCFGPEAADNLKQAGGNSADSLFSTWTSPDGVDYKFVNGAKPRTPSRTCVGF
jgi:hypothetical protein